MDKFYKTDEIKNEYDVVIIGGGPAGITAAIYASRDELSTLVLERLTPGGQMGTTAHIENYPGFELAIDGVDISDKFHAQGARFGAEIRNGTFTKLEIEGEYKLVYLEERAQPVKAKTVVISTGCIPKRLNTGANEIPGEEKFWGRGVSACATCDGGFYRGKSVVAVGGGNAALEEAEYLTRFASKVYLVHRRQEFRGSKIAQNAIMNNPKVELVLDSVVTSINGTDTLEGVTVKNIVTGEMQDLNVSGVFVFIGQNPQTQVLKDILALDDEGFIVAGENTETSVPGVFAAGDIRTKEVRQVVTAAADGAVAAKMAMKYIIGNF